MEENNAVITIVSVQDEDEEIEVVTAGKFYKEDGYYYAVYEETEASGMEGTVTTLKINDEGFSLMREGSITTTMNFKRNNEEDVLYSTPHGGLCLKLRTREVKTNVDENGGDINVEYDMIVGGQQHITTILRGNIKIK